jgi:serine protease AprX
MHVVAGLALAAVLAATAAPAIPADTPSIPLPDARIDPVLLGQLDAAGFAPAALTWDRTKVNRSDVVEYLDGSGLETDVLSGLSVAFACASSLNDINILAGAPGAVSVYGDRALHPALDHSVRTAMNGDPNIVWEGSQGVTGKGVAIAVIDTGVDGTHPDLEYGTKTKVNVRVVNGQHDLMGPYNDPCVQDSYSDQLQDSELTSGHGTHLASVAAGDGTVSGGRYKGVAPGADIIGVGIGDTITPRAVVDQNTQLSLFGAISGMNYAYKVGLEGCQALTPRPPLSATCDKFIPLTMKVILAGWTQDGLNDPWHPMTFIIRDLAWYGIVVVFPTGNEGPQPSDCSAAETCHYNAFAVAPDAIGVAATPKNSRTELASYSSRGDPVPRQPRGETVLYQPLLAAPGTGVIAARRPGVAPYLQPPGSPLGAGPSGQIEIDRRYVSMSGTSVSAAHVAGAVALMQEAAVKGSGCYLTADQVIDILRSTATPMPGYQPWEVGAGALDITAAVNASRGGGPFSVDPWMCPPGA